MDDDREDSEGDSEENRRGRRQLRTSDDLFSPLAKGKLP